MTLADIVFPFFLFIVGVAIPLAQNAPRGRACRAGRSLATSSSAPQRLLLLGVIEQNAGADRSLRRSLWEVLAFSAVLAAWCVVPRSPGIKRNVLLGLKALGCWGCVLLAMYRREASRGDPVSATVSNWVWLRIGWWGILGLIGWAYLTSSLLMLCSAGAASG